MSSKKRLFSAIKPPYDAGEGNAPGGRVHGERPADLGEGVPPLRNFTFHIIPVLGEDVKGAVPYHRVYA